MASHGTTQVGALLRQWRTSRGISQLALALEADTSMRHMSYIETGRARPSREMLLRLADALDVPLRERNALLVAGGYAPFYRETGLVAPELASARHAIDLMLAHHEPYPAIVLDRCWNMVRANPATTRFLHHFLAPCAPTGPRNAVKLMFDPHGLRPFIEEWDAVAGMLIQRVHREAATDPPDPETQVLLDTLLAYPGVPERWRSPDLDHPPSPMLAIGYRHDGALLRFFSMITTFGTPHDVTVQELRIESFFPADDATRAAFAAGGPLAPAPSPAP
jgi:transcriptional regulator with XRE-family HTH domain